MGLDIHIGINNSKEIYTTDYDNLKNKHSLSREFCNFMCRKDVVQHEPELNQIGRITGIDISSLYEMESYPDEDYILDRIQYEADTEEKKEKIRQEAEKVRNKLEGNIDKVLRVVNGIINNLNDIDHLDTLLIDTNFDTLNSAYYFSDFKIDKGEGYIGNNFGQDLRNFKRFLEYAKDRGTKTVWFRYD
jgi:hypothetical protein